MRSFCTTVLLGIVALGVATLTPSGAKAQVVVRPGPTIIYPSYPVYYSSGPVYYSTEPVQATVPSAVATPQVVPSSPIVPSPSGASIGIGSRPIYSAPAYSAPSYSAPRQYRDTGVPARRGFGYGTPSFWRR